MTEARLKAALIQPEPPDDFGGYSKAELAAARKAMKGKETLKAAILREVRRLGNKKRPACLTKVLSYSSGYQDGWRDACQELESALLEMFAKKEKG